MKVIIAGSRDCTNIEHLFHAIAASGWAADITEVVSGTARGADRLGEQWAEMHGVKCIRMPAMWNIHGKSAGYKRNAVMAAYGDALIALWDGRSNGTLHMITVARSKGLEVLVYNYRTNVVSLA